MSDSRLTKHWKVVEVQLRQAADFLTEPERFSIPDRELRDYEGYIDNNEFELAMDELAEIAIEYGCRSGFWRRIKKAAIQMELKDKAKEYERQFHKSLASDV